MPAHVDHAPTGRAVLLDSFGGVEVLAIREVPAPPPGPGQVRVRVTAAGLNPMDWIMTADADTAARFKLSLPSGFGTDYAGLVDRILGYLAPMLLGGPVTVLDSVGVTTIGDASRWRYDQVERVGPDLLVSLVPE